MSGKSAVVLVDDDEGVRVSLSLLLGALGHQVAAGATHAEAIAACRASGCVPSVVIADYRLASGTLGTEAVAAIRSEFGDGMRVVLLSGETTASLSAVARQLGATLIRKPADASAILAALQAPG